MLLFKTSKITHFEVFALGSAKLLEIEVEHGGESVDNFWLKEGLLDAFRQIVEHFHRFRGQRQVTATLTLVLTKRPLPLHLLLPAERTRRETFIVSQQLLFQPQCENSFNLWFGTA